MVPVFGMLTAMLIALACGCNPPANQLIEKVDMEVSPNLETITVTLQFTRNVRSDLLGEFAVGNYGNLFINPSTSANPFQLGFRLNTSIVNDQDIIRLTPVTTFPNGVNLPISLNAALVQINLPNPINPQFDIFAYVDVFMRRWLGSAVILKFIDGNFPSGLSVSQGFFLDNEGRPAVVASVFGPRVQEGRVTVPGGLAVFGNIQRILNIHQTYSAKAYRSYTTQAMKRRGDIIVIR